MSTSLSAAIAEACGLFGLEAICVSDQRLPSRANRLHRVSTASRHFVLRISPNDAKTSLENELSIHDQLAGGALSLRHWHRSSAGERVVGIPSGYAMLADYIPGKPLNPNLSGCSYSAGRNLAEIHIAPLKLPTPNSRALLSLRQIKLLSALPIQHPAMARVRSLLTDAGDITDEWRQLPAGVLHGDYHCANILVNERTPSLSILDFERATEAPFLFDVARAVADIARIGPTINDQLLADFLKGYQSVRGLDPLELEALPRWMAVASAIVATWCLEHGLIDLALDFLAAGSVSLRRSIRE